MAQVLKCGRCPSMDAVLESAVTLRDPKVDDLVVDLCGRCRADLALWLKSSPGGSGGRRRTGCRGPDVRPAIRAAVLGIKGPFAVVDVCQLVGSSIPSAVNLPMSVYYALRVMTARGLLAKSGRSTWGVPAVYEVVAGTGDGGGK